MMPKPVGHLRLPKSIFGKDTLFEILYNPKATAVVEIKHFVASCTVIQLATVASEIQFKNLFLSSEI